MSDFYSDIRIQQLGMLLVISLAIALLICGILLRRRRFLDRDKRGSRSASKSVSTVMLILSMLFGIVGILGLLLTVFS